MRFSAISLWSKDAAGSENRILPAPSAQYSVLVPVRATKVSFFGCLAARAKMGRIVIYGVVYHFLKHDLVAVTVLWAWF